MLCCIQAQFGNHDEGNGQQAPLQQELDSASNDDQQQASGKSS